MASAMMLPMVSSPFAEMVPICPIIFPLTGFEIFLISSTTTSTAFSMPRLSSIGLLPAGPLLSPSRKRAWASTVAVVVPSPATSEVLEATSRSILAPRFSMGSSRSISLATVTPSLVITGGPNFFSRTTLRPLGPRVIRTAVARLLTPRRIACRASSWYTICFAIFFLCLHQEKIEGGTIYRRLANNTEYLVFLEDDILDVIQFHLRAGVLPDENLVSHFDL